MKEPPSTDDSSDGSRTIRPITLDNEMKVPADKDTSSTQQAPPDLLNDEQWLLMNERQRAEYASKIARVRRECRSYASFTLSGNMYFIISCCIGGAISALAPPYWSMRKRSAPFFVAGLFGIIADNENVKRKCHEKYPLPNIATKIATNNQQHKTTQSLITDELADTPTSTSKTRTIPVSQRQSSEDPAEDISLSDK